ncbi:hypothetical protein BT96DRAFT_923276 [Gymnopus androsaceus JB14]|uniref:Uncharacterized protein n=1 Tax=Gymnopus androsaceus JB14 TaxID=1447944 RepID=A0A6A4GB00_9AGAR|nr:hypothetical protein BT96DRAFT_930198 [Gymnopus androsaceus JB14]KAE9394859.1 hypothetical protein BT96DRAFT_923276 [Gymnopus androsaceus JB14]
MSSAITRTDFIALHTGNIVSTFLYGITMLQIFSYYREYPKDDKYLKGGICTLSFSV